MWKMDIIDSYGPLFPYPKSLKFKFNLELHHVWFLLVTRRLETWPQLQKKQTAFFTLRLPYRFKRKLFFFLSSMLQVWSMVNLEIKFQIRLSNGILMDCWPISCGMAACKSGWNTINFLGIKIEGKWLTLNKLALNWLCLLSRLLNFLPSKELGLEREIWSL